MPRLITKQKTGSTLRCCPTEPCFTMQSWQLITFVRSHSHRETSAIGSQRVGTPLVATTCLFWAQTASSERPSRAKKKMLKVWGRGWRKMIRNLFCAISHSPEIAQNKDEIRKENIQFQQDDLAKDQHVQYLKILLFRSTDSSGSYHSFAFCF